MAKGKIYNISNRIGGGKPVMKFDEKHQFTINTTLGAVAQMKVLANDDKLDEEERIRKTIIVGIGQEGLDYVESLDLPFVELMVIINTITAATTGQELDEFMDEVGKPRGKKR